jgi:hypothetical protein
MSDQFILEGDPDIEALDAVEAKAWRAFIEWIKVLASE